MVIKPEAISQNIRFRSRPHTAQANYFIVVWTDNNKVFGFIEPLTYDDGYINGAVTLPLSVGLSNGAKMNFRCFPVTGDGSALAVAMVAATDNDPFQLSISEFNAFILAEIIDETILDEVYRGQIFVSDKDQQPYNVT
jgi:hypothetical protein